MRVFILPNTLPNTIPKTYFHHFINLAPYKQFSCKVGSTSVKCMNTSSLASQIHRIKDTLKDFRVIIFVHKKAANPTHPDHRYLPQKEPSKFHKNRFH